MSNIFKYILLDQWSPTLRHQTPKAYRPLVGLAMPVAAPSTDSFSVLNQ